MLPKIIATDLRTLKKLFAQIPFTQGGVIEIADYILANAEEKEARALTRIVQSPELRKKLLYIRETHFVWDLYQQAWDIDTSRNKKVTWLLYGGVLNYCLQQTIFKIMEDKEDLPRDSVTWIGLPLFAINKAHNNYLNGLVRYPGEDNIIADLVKGSHIDRRTGTGYLCTPRDKNFPDWTERYFCIEYPIAKRVVIRQNGMPLKVLNPKGGPTFVLDFYDSWSDLFTKSFRGRIDL